jgi:hypothetical protein
MIKAHNSLPTELDGKPPNCGGKSVAGKLYIVPVGVSYKHAHITAVSVKEGVWNIIRQVKDYSIATVE